MNNNHEIEDEIPESEELYEKHAFVIDKGQEPLQAREGAPEHRRLMRLSLAG